jgi:hypothetical protein
MKKGLFSFFVIGACLQASVIGTTGNVIQVAPPATVQVNQNENTADAILFTEQTDFILPTSVTADILVPGTYLSSAGMPQGTIAAGTAVDSYYYHSDPVGKPSPGVGYQGSITFSTPILGVIALVPELIASNSVLGYSGTTYPEKNEGQGFEFGNPRDSVTISVDRTTLFFNNIVGPASDDLRIITAATTPEPATMGLFGASLIALAAVIRKRFAITAR